MSVVRRFLFPVLLSLVLLSVAVPSECRAQFGPGTSRGVSTFVVDASRYGAVPNDGVDDTVAIQAALDAVNTIGGGVVEISYAGVYEISLLDAGLFSALTIGSNTELNIKPGVILRRKAGSPCYMIRNKAQSAGNTGIRIWGGGTIDGNAKWIGLDGSYTHSTKTFTFTVTGTPAATYSFSSGDTLDVTAISGGGGTATSTMTINSATNDGTTLSIVTATSPNGSTGNSTANTVDVRINRTSTLTADATVGWLGQGILLQNCTDWSIRDLSMLNECKYSIWAAGGQRFDVQRIRFATASDGVHVEGTGSAVTGMSTPLSRTSEFVIRDISGWCGDNKVAFGTDEGTYYTPNGGPFSKGSIRQGVVENITCENDWEPVRLFGSSTSLDVSEITFRNLYGTVRRGQGFKLATDVNGLTSGASFKRIIVENISLTCGQSGSCPVYIDGSGVEDVTIRGLVSTQTSNTAALVYCVSTNLRALTIQGGTVGSTSAGYQGKVVEFGASNANVPKVVIRDLTGYINGGRVILVNHASVAVDATIDGCRIVYGGGAGNGGDMQLLDVISTNAGGNFLKVVGSRLDGLVSGGTNGTVFKNQITAASASTNYLTLIGNVISDWENVLTVADDADNKTIVRSFGNTLNNVAAFVTGPLSAGAVSTPGSSVGLVRFLCPDVTIDGTWTRGTQVAGDTFINTSAAASGGSPSTNWGTLGSLRVVYKSGAWAVD